MASEFLHIKIAGSHANLLIGIESYAYLSMTYLRMLHEPHHSLDNLCNTSLVVCSKESPAVCDNKILADMVKKFWETARGRDNTL